MAKEFEHILNECIDRLLRGESVEQCLECYPEQAAELEPLLRVAQTAHKTSSVEPRPEFKAQARQNLRSVLYGPERRTQPRRISLLGFAKSRVALASFIAIALVVGLSLLVPALFRQPTVVLAEEIAMDDPGVQILLAEKEFQPSEMHRVVTKSDTANVYLVKFTTSEDSEPIVTVTVNVKERIVTDIGLNENGDGEQFTRLLSPALAVSNDITRIAELDSRVQNILETGGEIGGISYFFSPLRKVVGLDLRSDGKKWVVMIDPEKREVVSIFKR